jgi:hypothetical protein
VWLSEDVAEKWYEQERMYDGTGTPNLFIDFTILTCHEIRQVYRLPLRQCESFINSSFKVLGVSLVCSDYTTLSKRLKALKISSPKHKKYDRTDDSVHAIAIDSTGLKRFGRNEWHQEKYELSSNASWRKLHIGVNGGHYFEACSLTDRFASDESQIKPLLDQIDDSIDHFLGDGAYDKTPVHEAVLAHSPAANIVIPPREDAVLSAKVAEMRNRNLQEIITQRKHAVAKLPIRLNSGN